MTNVPGLPPAGYNGGVTGVSPVGTTAHTPPKSPFEISIRTRSSSLSSPTNGHDHERIPGSTAVRPGSGSPASPSFVSPQSPQSPQSGVRDNFKQQLGLGDANFDTITYVRKLEQEVVQLRSGVQAIAREGGLAGLDTMDLQTENLRLKKALEGLKLELAQAKQKTLARGEAEYATHYASHVDQLKKAEDELQLLRKEREEFELLRVMQACITLHTLHALHTVHTAYITRITYRTHRSRNMPSKSCSTRSGLRNLKRCSMPAHPALNQAATQCVCCAAQWGNGTANRSTFRTSG